MSGRPRAVPVCAHLFADHLDAVLALGEQIGLQRLDLAGSAAARDPLAFGSALRGFVETVRTLEMALIARALLARDRARELTAVNADLRRLLVLFVGGTAALADAVEELGDATLEDFDTGDDPLAYLRSRGLLAPDAGSLLGLTEITAGESLLIARRIELGALLDLAAAGLNALEDCYELFEKTTETVAQPAPGEPAQIG